MRPPRHSVLVEKSVSACLVALEVYNKPDFRYREESFSILMLNAWELLLKARVVQQNGGKLRAIEVWEPRKNKDGSESKRLKKRVTWSGNPFTIGLNRAIRLVQTYKPNGIDQCCVENLALLKDIRDSSVHFHNVTAGLGKRIQGVGAASLRNFVAAVEAWFKVDLNRYNFYLMPLAFHSPSEVVVGLRKDRQPRAVRQLLDRITQSERDNPSDEGATFHVTMEVQLRFVRTADHDASPVRNTRDPGAVPVNVTEADIRAEFPWDYPELSSRLKSRYRDFVVNQKYHEIRKPLQEKERFCRVRYLDPSKPKGQRKIFYSPGIVAEFDSHYTKG